MKEMKIFLLSMFLLLSLCTVDVLGGPAVRIILIRADGAIEGTNKIYRSGNTYIFSGDIKDLYGIIVEKKDIVIDGKGHTLKATPRILPVGSWDFGIELSNATQGNVTVKNLNIVDFNIGVYVWTENNTILQNTIKGSSVGIFLAGSPNTVIANYIENNEQGVFLGPLSSDHPTVYNVFHHNSFVNNTSHVYDCECDDPELKQHLNVWDNGASGNYWDDYTGVDHNGDGIGDTPYSVSEDDVDIAPLMEPVTPPYAEKQGFLGLGIPWELGILLTAGSFILILLIIRVLSKRKE